MNAIITELYFSLNNVVANASSTHVLLLPLVEEGPFEVMEEEDDDDAEEDSRCESSLEVRVMMASSTMAASSSVSGVGLESKAMDFRRRLDFLFVLRFWAPPARPRFDSKSRMSSMS